MAKRFSLIGIGLVLALGLAGGVWAEKSASLFFPLPAPADAMPAGSPVATHGKLSVSGSKIVDKSGTAVQLKGMSFFWSNSGVGGIFYNEKVISWLAHDWKVDVLRVAMGAETDGTNKGYSDGDKATQELLARAAIEECIKRGVYVIIDFHSHKEHRSEAVTFFKDMATSYGKYPHVLYEIWNEPLDAGGGNGVSGGTIADYASTVGSAIRNTNGAEGIIIVGSPRWSSQPGSVNVSGVTNVAYSMHFYAAEHRDSYRNDMTSAASSKAIFATEWGTTNAKAKGGIDKTESDKWISEMDKNKIGWANWSISSQTKDNDDATSILSGGGTQGGWSDNDFTESGKYIRGKFPKGNGTYKVTVTQPAAGGKIDVSKLKSSYGWGESLELTAVPNDGWEIKTWTGNATGNSPSLKGLFYALNPNISAEFYECGVIKNGHFTYDAVGWVQVADNGAKTNPMSVANSELVVDVTTAGASVWDVRVGNSATTGMLAADHQYELKFKARSAAARDIYVRLSSSNYISIYGDTLKASLTTTAQTFTHKFTVRRGAAIQGGAVGFFGGDKTGKWYISEVSLKDLGSVGGNVGVSRPAASAVRTSWAVVKSGSGVQLRGPAENGAEISIYDTRGKLVRSLAAVDGLNLSSGIVNAPAGNYLLVVRNNAGAEIYKTMFTMTR
nr:glycoside hydrolase family 5 [uncultured bacterium]